MHLRSIVYIYIAHWLYCIAQMIQSSQVVPELERIETPALLGA